MFNLFNNIDSSLGNRYKTVETNIKSKSNSFYESLLALLESLAKIIVRDNNIRIDAEHNTLMAILKNIDFKKYCLSNNLIDQDYKALKIIAGDVNNHKHNSEKELSLETMLSYMGTAYKFGSMYYEAKLHSYPEKYNLKYLVDLYGQNEKELDALLKEKKDLQDSLLKESNASYLLQKDLERVKEIAKSKEIEYSNLEEQKNAYLKQISELKDIKLSSMEEKMNNIIEALKNQNILLSEVSATLKETNKILETRNFSGRHTVFR